MILRPIPAPSAVGRRGHSSELMEYVPTIPAPLLIYYATLDMGDKKWVTVLAATTPTGACDKAMAWAQTSAKLSTGIATLRVWRRGTNLQDALRFDVAIGSYHATDHRSVR